MLVEREGARAVMWTGRNDMRATLTTPVIKIEVVGGRGSHGVYGSMTLFTLSGYGFDFTATKLEEIVTCVGNVPETIYRCVIDYNLRLAVMSGQSSNNMQ